MPGNICLGTQVHWPMKLVKSVRRLSALFTIQRQALLPSARVSGIAVLVQVLHLLHSSSTCSCQGTCIAHAGYILRGRLCLLGLNPKSLRSQ
jgi:hypothetical protein